MCKNTDSISSNSNKTNDLPSTLQGPPVSSLVPLGECQFGAEPTKVTLMQRFPVSETSAVLRFALPDATKPLNLSTCACILAQADIDGELVKRPYTPISTNQMIGSFDLLVKSYGPTAKMSRKLHEILPGDDSISFLHIPFNVKIQANDFLQDHDHIGMLVGGTGITPMIQALHAILGAPSTTAKVPKVTMLYGSKTSDDILGQELLHKWSQEFAGDDRFKLLDILSHEPEDSDWKGERGFISKNLIAQHFPAASPNLNQKIFVCGPPPMYNALCGPREEQDKVTGVLAELGYTAEQVYKF